MALATHCLYWARPEVEWTDIGPKKPRAVGLAFHAWVQAAAERNLISVDEAAARFALSDLQTRVLRALVDAWSDRFQPRVGWRAEVAYAYDPHRDAVRELGQSLERGYDAAGRQPWEIAGSADLVTMDGDSVVVFDWKTGFQSRLAPAATNKQLRFLAMCAARVYGCDQARVIVVRVAEDAVDVNEGDLDAAALKEAAADARARASLLESNPAPQPGPHCAEMWCPAVAACSATMTAIEELAPIDAHDKRHLPMVSNKSAIRSIAHAAWVWHRIAAIATALEAASASLKAYADEHGPVPVGDGRVYRRIEEKRETVVVDDRARAVLEMLLGARSASVLKVTVTKKAVSEAARAVAGRGKPGAELGRTVLDRLREVGAVKVSIVTSHEAVNDDAA